jgi:hypothetical protein
METAAFANQRACRGTIVAGSGFSFGQTNGRSGSRRGVAAWATNQKRGLRGRHGRDRPRGEPDRVAADYRFDPIVSKNSTSTRFPVLAICETRPAHKLRPAFVFARVPGLAPTS